MAYASQEKQREYCKAWMAARRAAFFTGKKCVRCGSADKLQLDHINPKTKTSHSIWSWAEKRRAEEIAKCQVLCNVCHYKKTGFENSVRTKGALGAKQFRLRKLSAENAQAVKAFKSAGATSSSVARRFGIDHKTVEQIWRGETYVDMPPTALEEAQDFR